MPRAALDPARVTEAAASIVSARGPAALTLSRLAADLGVAPPSLYKHVAGLDDLLVRVTTLSIGRLADALTAAALGRSGRTALEAIADAYRRYAVGHAGLYALIQTVQEAGSPALRSETARAIGVVEAVVASYGVPEGLSGHAVRMVRAGLHGFADIEARGGFRLPFSIDASFLVMVDAIDASLRGLGDETVASSGK